MKKQINFKKPEISIKEENQFHFSDCAGVFKMHRMSEDKIILELSPKIFCVQFKVDIKLPKGMKKPKSITVTKKYKKRSK